MARVNISLPDELLKEVDEYCLINHLQRSELLRHLIRIEIYHEKSLERNHAKDFKESFPDAVEAPSDEDEDEKENT